MQKKIDKIKDKDNIQDQDKFVKEIKISFSDKNKIVDIKQKIKTFRQEKKHITDFMIEFEALAMKAETDNMYTIFLLKKNIRSDIIKMILKYPPITVPYSLKEQKVAITLVR